MREWIEGLAARLLSGDAIDEARPLLAALDGSGHLAAAAFLDLSRLIGEAADPAAAIVALHDAPADLVAILGALVVRCFASVRLPLPSQREAALARDQLSMAAAQAYSVISPDIGPDVLSFAARLVGETARQLSENPANRIPVVDVETAISLPSSYLAWHLYADPTRGAEISDRNGGATPMLMPTRVEALAV